MLYNMMQVKSPIDLKLTKEGLEKLKAEFAELTEKRPQVLERMVAAREMGDLSENAGYHASKEELLRIDNRLAELKVLMRLGQVVEPKSQDKVQIGTSVELTNGKDFFEYKIVGQLEGDPANGKISEVSPAGSALIGKKAGDEVEIETPNGTTSYKIVKIK